MAKSTKRKVTCAPARPARIEFLLPEAFKKRILASAKRNKVSVSHMCRTALKHLIGR
ncbi:MAG TPA: hypothetical protein PKY29_04315 [Ferruginibacter sp.]|nr:hypothetical protein [Ferruginibacter sp.]HRQ20512.1 hypothetical protein [Ferruginibacter sp.]